MRRRKSTAFPSDSNFWQPLELWFCHRVTKFFLTPPAAAPVHDRHYPRTCQTALLPFSRRLDVQNRVVTANRGRDAR